jgi:hypothetical protein
MSKVIKPLTVARFHQRLLSKIVIDEASGCWLWRGSTSSQYKYPSAGHPTKPKGMIFVHRYLFEQAHGPIEKVAADGTRNELHHRTADGCQGKKCVNPRHMKVLSARSHGKVSAMEKWLKKQPQAPKMPAASAGTDAVAVPATQDSA